MDALTSALHDDRANEHDRAVKQLRQFSQGAPPDDDSDELFRHLDRIRRMQIDLALEHLAMEGVQADHLELPDLKDDPAGVHKPHINEEVFAKRENDVNGLMMRLEELSQAMQSFRGSMDELRTHSAELKPGPAVVPASRSASERRTHPRRPANISEKSTESKFLSDKKGSAQSRS